MATVLGNYLSCNLVVSFETRPIWCVINWQANLPRWQDRRPREIGLAWLRGRVGSIDTH